MDQHADQQPQTVPFSTRTEFHELIHRCIAKANIRLQLFDPDFSAWNLGSAQTVQILHEFLTRKNTNRLQLAMHKTSYLQLSCPRFLALLKKFDHVIECRITPRNLQKLSDSFCLADNLHLVRRFHSDHFRGVATFDSEADTQICTERFAGIWTESLPGLHVTTVGL